MECSGLPIGIQEWIGYSSQLQPKYLPMAIDLARMLTKRLREMVAAGELKLHDITAENVSILMEVTPVPSIKVVHFELDALKHRLNSRLCFEWESNVKMLVEPFQAVISIYPSLCESAMLIGDVESAMICRYTPVKRRLKSKLKSSFKSAGAAARATKKKVTFDERSENAEDENGRAGALLVGHCAPAPGAEAKCDKGEDGNTEPPGKDHVNHNGNIDENIVEVRMLVDSLQATMNLCCRRLVRGPGDPFETIAESRTNGAEMENGNSAARTSGRRKERERSEGGDADRAASEAVGGGRGNGAVELKLLVADQQAAIDTLSSKLLKVERKLAQRRRRD